MKYGMVFFIGAIVAAAINDSLIGAVIGGIATTLLYKVFSYLTGKWVE